MQLGRIKLVTTSKIGPTETRDLITVSYSQDNHTATIQNWSMIFSSTCGFDWTGIQYHYQVQEDKKTWNDTWTWRKTSLSISIYQNKAQQSEKAISDTVYIEELRNFTIETYYVILTKAFNNLADEGLYTVLWKNRRLIILKAALKGKIPSVIWLWIAYTGKALMILERYLRTNIISYSHISPYT